MRTTRWLVVAAMAGGLTLGACGSSEKKETAGSSFTAAPDQDALASAWSDGANTISFNGNGSYMWEKMRPCGAPPCPTTATEGKWALRGGSIYLSGAEGEEVIGYTFSDEQKGLALTSNKQGLTWNLRKR